MKLATNRKASWWQQLTRRDASWLTAADKRILTRYAEHRDPRILTGYYFNWDPFDQQVGVLCAGLGYPHAADAYQYRYVTTGVRGGKTEVNAFDLALGAMLIPGLEAISLYCSITQDQASIAWKIAQQFMVGSPRFEHWVADVVQSPFPEITLNNGHRLWARSTQNNCERLRSHKFVRTNYDEIAFGKSDDVHVLLTRLADYNGQFAGFTTPKGKGWYYRERWHPALVAQQRAAIEKRRANVRTAHWTSRDNPHVNPEYWARAEMTDRQRAQEVEAQFLDSETQPWTPDQVEAIVNPDLEPDVKRYRPDTPGAKPAGAATGERWLCAWDLAYKADWVVGIAGRIDCKPWKVLWYTRYNRVPWPAVERDIDETQKRFKADVALDASGVGDVTLAHLNVATHRLHPLVYTPKLKTAMVTNLQRCIQQKLVEIPFIEQLVNELYDYEWDDKGLVQDSVMALAEFCWIAAGQPAAAVGMI